MTFAFFCTKFHFPEKESTGKKLMWIKMENFTTYLTNCYNYFFFKIVSRLYVIATRVQ